MRAALVVLLLWLSGPALACAVPGDAVALRGAMLASVNTLRMAEGRASLTADADLDMAAQEQACHMAERERVSHRGSWFAGLGRRLRRVGYTYSMAVENLAAGQASVAEVAGDWAASPEHRANILAPQVREVGFGTARAVDGRLHWVMIGAARR